MKITTRLLVAVLGALAAIPVLAEVHQREWGIATTINFVLYTSDGPLDVNEVDGGSEVSLSCDEGAETEATNDFVDEGTYYSIAITAEEMECARIAVVVAATDTNVAFIETNGSPADQGTYTGGLIGTGTAQSVTATTVVLDASFPWADDDLIGALIQVCSATQGYCQTKTVTDYVASTDTVTVDTFNTTPAGTTIYRIYGVPPSTVDAEVWAYATRELTRLDEDDTTIDIDGSQVGGIAGTINTLDGLDTAQDTQHATTQGLVNGLNDPTAAAIRAEMDSNSSQLAAIVLDTAEIGAAGAGLTEAGGDGDHLTAIAAALLGTDIEDQDGGYDLACSQAVLLAYVAGEWSQSGNVVTYQDPGGNETRFTATLSGDGLSRPSISITCP